MTNDSPAKTSIASEFPVGYMLENLAVRADGSVLIAAVNRRQVWCVPAPIGKEPVAPVLLHTFDEGHLTMSFVEAEPDIFYVAIFGHPSLYRFDMRDWTPETAVTFTKAVEFEKPAGPNGAALLAPGVMLFSDSTEGLIWRVDLSEDGLHGKPSVWLKHPTMASPGAGHKPVSFNNEMQVPFPGINGLYYGDKGNMSTTRTRRRAPSTGLPSTRLRWSRSGTPSSSRTCTTSTTSAWTRTGAWPTSRGTPTIPSSASRCRAARRAWTAPSWPVSARP